MPEEQVRTISQRMHQKADRVLLMLLCLSPFCDWVVAP